MRALILAIALLALGAPVSAATDYRVPTGPGWTDGTNVRGKLQAFIDSVPNGSAHWDHSRIVFPDGYTWTVSGSLNFTGKRHLTVDGGTIRTTANGDSLINDSIILARSMTTEPSMVDVTFHGMTLEGTSDDYRTTRCRTGGEYGAAFALLGVRDVEISRVTTGRNHGDSVFLGDSMHGTSSDGLPSRTVWIHDSTFRDNGRAGLAAIWARDVMVERNRFAGMCMSFLDIEPDRAFQRSANITVRGNDLEGPWNWEPAYTATGIILTGTADGMYDGYLRVANNTVSGRNHRKPSSPFLMSWWAPTKTGMLIFQRNRYVGGTLGGPLAWLRYWQQGGVVTDNTGWGTSEVWIENCGPVMQAGNN